MFVESMAKSKGTDESLGCEAKALLGGGVVVRDYESVPRGFMGRHRSKLAAMLALLLLVYLITATFCGWNVDSCRSK